MNGVIAPPVNFRTNLPAQKKLIIPSDFEQIAVVESFIEELQSDLNIGESAYANIIVSVTEAVNNGIAHGNRCDPHKKVSIETQLLNEFLLSVRVEDEGEGFNFNDVPDPTGSADAMLDEHGRGVFVMRNFADSIQYLGKGNVVEMQFNI